MDPAVGGAEEGHVRTVSVAQVPVNWRILDIGEGTVQSFASALQGVHTAFWNGPVGLFERQPFDRGSLAVARIFGELKATWSEFAGCASSPPTIAFTELWPEVDDPSAPTIEFSELGSLANAAGVRAAATARLAKTEIRDLVLRVITHSLHFGDRPTRSLHRGRSPGLVSDRCGNR